MSRYTGPRVHVLRALGTELPGLSRKKIERRPYPPGQHGQARKKLSEYALRLREKQKLRYGYGVSEKQLRNLVREANKSRIAPGEKLLELLERRLDNVVFRAGFARTIPAARQMVNHGHVLVGGHRVDIASYRVSVGDVITVTEKARKQTHILAALADTSMETPGWLEIDKGELKTTLKALPDSAAVPFPIEIRQVVEFYAMSI